MNPEDQSSLPQTEITAPPFRPLIVYPIPLDDGFTVARIGIPPDITESEINKIIRVMRAICR